MSLLAGSLTARRSPFDNETLRTFVGGFYMVIALFFTGSLGCFKVCLTWQAWDF